MPLPKNPTAYAHVKQILDAALPHAKCVFTLPSREAAVRWRQEAYYFRRLSGSDVYADLMLRLDGPKVIIERKHVVGKLTTHDGTVIEPLAIAPEVQLEEAEKFAFNFAKKLGLEVDDDL